MAYDRQGASEWPWSILEPWYHQAGKASWPDSTKCVTIGCLWHGKPRYRVGRWKFFPKVKQRDSDGRVFSTLSPRSFIHGHLNNCDQDSSALDRSFHPVAIICSIASCVSVALSCISPLPYHLRFTFYLNSSNSSNDYLGNIILPS